MPELPTRIQVGPYVYTVRCDKAAIDAKRVRDGAGTGLVGYHDSSELSITLCPDVASGLLIEALLHEVLHAVISTSGMRGDSFTEEQVVEHISPMLLDTLRRNPSLVAYLCGQDEAVARRDSSGRFIESMAIGPAQSESVNGAHR